MLYPKPKRVENRELLDEIKTRQCTAGGDCHGDMTPAHIKTRGSRAPDEEWNVMPLCMIHHITQGQIGWFKFANKYPSVLDWLERHGWYFESPTNKLRRSHGSETP